MYHDALRQFKKKHFLIAACIIYNVETFVLYFSVDKARERLLVHLMFELVY